MSVYTVLFDGCHNMCHGLFLGGNAGMAAAYVARKMGLPATIVVPSSTPQLVVQRLKDQGATVKIVGKVEFFFFFFFLSLSSSGVKQRKWTRVFFLGLGWCQWRSSQAERNWRTHLCSSIRWPPALVDTLILHHHQVSSFYKFWWMNKIGILQY